MSNILPSTEVYVYGIAAVFVVVVLGFVAVIFRSHPKPLPPIIRQATTVIAARPTDSTKIAHYRDVDSIHAGKAQVAAGKIAATDDAAKALEASFQKLRTEAAQRDTDNLTKIHALQAAVDTASATIDTLHHAVALRDTVIAEQRVELTAKEGAFQVSDRRRRELEPLVVGLRDSLVKALKPPSRWHLFGITCGAAGIQKGVSLGCSLGPTFTP